MRQAADSTTTYVMFTMAYLGSSYAVAMSVVNNPSALNVILSLLGATTGTLIAYVIPTIIYAKMFPEPHLKRTAALIVCAYGLISMPFCISATFL